MPARTAAVRRSRSAIENEEDADSIRAESRPTSSGSDFVKRPRLNGNGNHHNTASATLDHSVSENGNLRPPRPSVNGRANRHITRVDQRAKGEFQTGAIVRVKVTNFVTYENAEFFPGPNLNMVIGPNGTGKSSLVCALCLGLGWGPGQLGRASTIGEFVKHGMKEAFVEIELQGHENESHNIIVKVQIIRENSKREWWLNNKKSSLKAVQGEMKKLNVQIDNLCQFLPQDKVSEFAAMSPVELLNATQRAAAPPEMVQCHEDLKELRKEQKAIQAQSEADQEILTNYEGRQQNLRAEVEKLERRKEIQKRISLLERTVPLVEYATAKKTHKEVKRKMKAAEDQLKKLETEIEPLMRSVNQKEEYKKQVDVVVNERKKALDQAERAADSLVERIDRLDEQIKGNETEIKAHRDNETARKLEVQKLKVKIRDCEIGMQRGKPTFSRDWNREITSREREDRTIEAELSELTLKNKDFISRGREIRASQQAANEELESLDSQEGQQINKLQALSRDTAKLWKFVQGHKDQFEKEVFGPPVITCSVKDPRYADAIEALLQSNMFLTIVAQTFNDNMKLRKTIDVMRLAEVRTVIVGPGGIGEALISDEQLKELGLDAWAVDLVDGPAPVLKTLFGSKTAAIGLREVSNSQFERIVENRSISRFVVGDQLCTTSYRAEYDQSSTMTRRIRRAQLWTDAPADQTANARNEIEARIAALEAEFQRLNDEHVKPLRQKVDELRERRKELVNEIAKLKEDKGAEQKAIGQWDAIPIKKQHHETALEVKEREGEAYRETVRSIGKKWDSEILEKAKLGLQHKDLVAKIRSCHEELLEAEFIQIEAASDVEDLKNKNSHNDQRLQEERQKLKDATRESEVCQAEAKKKLAAAQEAIGAANDDDEVAAIKDLAAEHPDTAEDLINEIAAERAKLELIHAGNPNAIKEFERRQVQLDDLQTKVAASKDRVETLDHEIIAIRGDWEPKLDSMVASISEAFALNFETIGCNGEVSVHKDDDFELWAIEIKVKFRENETLQLLDAHRQSGGERSVSTIFYLMALQSLAKSPFRVVDEINQGMDPRNERMVHERMVDIACQEYTSQYFLITPKLLTGLRYDRRMKVLCIASGEHMPENYKQLDVSRIIKARRAMIAAR